ncbi:MAG: 4Fe-4S cluster-binding domain-containing protein [Oscillospiraceae bacterium]|nr:4Fe-4S cluster-binding domain-containing protein [Oscillospiraceae bacterium]
MNCTLCPRLCHAERSATRGEGFCGMPAGIVAARAMLHHWEEPCLSGTRGAGCVFFSGCSLGCVYCQNGSISRERFGKPITPERLREIFDELIARGAHCIDLVTPTHFTPWILPALREPLGVPVVWNCGGYERVETLRTLEGRVQVYLPDFKYGDDALAAALSRAPDYRATALAALREMFRQVGPYRMGEDGLLQSGLLIRHMLLPGCLDNTRRVIDAVAETFRPGEVLFSLLRQYTPQPNAEGTLARRVTGAEYRAALAYMDACGLREGFVQEKSSAKEEYTPVFDLSGL